MSKKIRAFIGYLKVLVNGETLGGGFYRFLSVHACFLVFYGLPHVFINTMLLGQTGDVKVVVMYNATFFLGSAAAMRTEWTYRTPGTRVAIASTS